MKRFGAFAVSALIMSLVAGCGVMDNQIGSRVDTINQSTDAARNNSILLNIIRASQSQPLNFVPISKASGSQGTDFRLGLPNVSFGPPALHQYVFGPNSLDNSAQTSFDSAPLETHDFYSDMLSSVPLPIIASMIRQGFARELMLDAMIGSFRLESPGGVIEIRNDPLDDLGGASCPSVSHYYGDNGDKADENNLYNPANLALYKQHYDCEYRRFEFVLQQAMKWGLTVETRDIPNKDYTDAAAKKAAAAGKDPPAKTVTSSRFCFDPAFAKRDQVASVMAYDDRCGGPWKAGDNNVLKFAFGNGKTHTETLKLVVLTRSPFGVFRYFGHILRAEPDHPVRLYWRDAMLQAGGVNVFSVTTGTTQACFASVSYFGHHYCVPYNSSDATKQVFAMLAELVALNTTTGSLPTTLDVRVQ